MLLKDIETKLEERKERSAWKRGVKAYALDIIESMIENNGEEYDFCGSPTDLKEALNGADDWRMYSEGGCSLIYNSDIAERLCSPSELKRSKDGQYNPNSRENWIDCQTRALNQAYRMIKEISREFKRV